MKKTEFLSKSMHAFKKGLSDAAFILTALAVIAKSAVLIKDAAQEIFPKKRKVTKVICIEKIDNPKAEDVHLMHTDLHKNEFPNEAVEIGKKPKHKKKLY